LPVAPSPEAGGKSRAGDYGDFVWQTDQVVGRLLDALDQSKMSENTLVIFTSDNGGLWHWWQFSADDDGGNVPITPRGKYVRQFGHRSNADWRGTKADIFEGGHRVPFIVRWPSRVDAGQVSDALIELTDVFATVAEIVEANQIRGESGTDSFSFLPLLDGEREATRSFSVHHSLSGMFALRRGDWKLIDGRGSGGFTRPNRLRVTEGDPEGQLYNLDTDPREQESRWSDEPDLVVEMRSLLERIRNSSAREAATKNGRKDGRRRDANEGG
jgi:arylsulfatase A-like enzyme